jgi:uncharacterized OsmC-like protein
MIPHADTPTGQTEFSVSLQLNAGYAQRVHFDSNGPDIVMDEAPPLGDGFGPAPTRMLAAAVGGCLAASLAFCMRKARLDLQQIETTVHGAVARDARGRLRVRSLDVLLEPTVPAEQIELVPRCASVFEDYCTVTASIRSALPVHVTVVPQIGVERGAEVSMATSPA